MKKALIRIVLVALALVAHYRAWYVPQALIWDLSEWRSPYNWEARW